MPKVVESMPRSNRGRKVQYEWLHDYCAEPLDKAGEYPQGEFHDSGFGSILMATRGIDFKCGVASFVATVCRVTDKAGLGVIVSHDDEGNVWIQAVSRDIKRKVSRPRKNLEEAITLEQAEEF